MAKVYISSTYQDLKLYRDAVYRILRMLRHDVISMEDYVATDAYPLRKCLDDVAASDVYVGLVGWRYGYRPDQDNPQRKSITELEYRQAEISGLPKLMFLADEEAPWPDELKDAKTGDGDHGQLIARFRAELEGAKLVSHFRTPDHLAGLVSVAIQRYLQSKPVSEVLTRSRVRAVRQEVLQGLLDSTLEDYQVATEQLAYTLGNVERTKLGRQIESLERELERLERRLDEV